MNMKEWTFDTWLLLPNNSSIFAMNNAYDEISFHLIVFPLR